MDRFIVYNIDFELTQPENLKSNMDRFIGKSDISFEKLSILFKIQYG